MGTIIRRVTHDELQYVICKNLETEYMLKLGGLEYKVFEAQCVALRLKRKIELIQAKRNRQETINLTKIDETLDLEFEAYQKQLNAQIEKMNDALERSKGEVLSEADTKEIKKLYRQIVKELHPDIHPDISASEAKMFDNAVNAYKNGDLATLRIIHEMVAEHQLPEEEKDALTQLKEEKERLEGVLKFIRESIEKIKSEYPYNMKEILEDEVKVSQKKAELEEALSQYKELITGYKLKIEEMLR